MVPAKSDSFREQYRVDNLPYAHEVHIPFGLPYLDYITCGGVPRGALTLLWGKPNAGKTTLALLAARNCEHAAILDSEGSISRDRLEQLGVEHLEIYRPPHLTIMLNIAQELIEEDYDLVILDSPSAIPVKELEDLDGTPPLGLRTRQWNRFLRNYRALVGEGHGTTALIAIQHLTKQIQVNSYVPPSETPALGEDQLAMAQLIIRCRSEPVRARSYVYSARNPGKDERTETKTTVALRVHWEVTKVKWPVPDLPNGSFDIGLVDYEPYKPGIVEDVVDREVYVMRRGIVRVRGAFYETPVGKLHGRKQLLEALRTQWDAFARAAPLPDENEEG